MSVYTTITEEELHNFLSHYQAGTLIKFEGILAGIENTNYFVTTDQGEYVLTLFEQLGWDELPYFLDIMAFLAEHQVPSAHPIADRNGDYLRWLNQKPAALVERLNGSSVDQPTTTQCAALGSALGRMHAMAHQFSGQRQNPRNIHWCQQSINQLSSQLSSEQQQLLSEELHFQSKTDRENLPQGVIHADLFRDNALFVDEQLTGIIDFYYACNDALLYDLAVTLNDWCISPDGSVDPVRYQSLLDHYQQQRPISGREKESWSAMLRAAALRFWLSRLLDLHFPRAGEMTHTKDPEVFRKILMWHRDHPLSV
jgi:homoserine kinase type II